MLTAITDGKVYVYILLRKNNVVIEILPSLLQMYHHHILYRQ